MRTEPLRQALLVALLLASGTAAADWMREYDRGLKAIKDGDWTTAQRQFEQALREDATPVERKRFQGVRVEPYVPHYYAGLAAFQQGNCEKAVEYWTHAPTEAVLGKLAALRAEQQRGLATCRTRLAQAAPATTAPATATPPVAAPATSTPTTVASTPASATATSGRPPSATATPSTPVAAAPSPVASAPPATAPAASTRPPASAAPAAAAPPAAGGAAPAVLRSTVEAYLAGRYADVQRVDTGAAPDARARAQLHLLRAAAAFTLATAGGEGEAGLEPARREVRAARAAQGNLSPDPVLFSPRFRNFWQQTR